MSISFNCPCGKVLSAKEWDAGKKGVCPDCGRKVVVPGKADPSSREDPAKQLARQAAKMENWLFSHQRQIWIGAGFTAGLLVVIIAGAVFSPNWKSNPDSPEPPPSIVVTPPEDAPRADPTQWKTNFASFAEAIQLAIRDQENLEDKFQGQMVEWTVTYRSCKERVNLYFDEAQPLLEANRGINIWATLLPSEASKTDNLKRGTQVVIRGKIGTVTSARTAEHPLGVVILGPIECTVEAI
jgi:hypothetical protein